MARPPEPEPPGPRPIRRLQESLINRIAAGEVQDNGVGIRVRPSLLPVSVSALTTPPRALQHADLPRLAERFTTSKLTTFADLAALRTYGFRGEALASVSHVAHLSVVTKTRADSCAWRACYVDGALAPPKPGQTPDPKPCAGNDGTTITLLREYARILDVVTRYAVHNPAVAFVCKKAGSPTPDLSTPSHSSTAQAIRLLYGASVARELLSASFSSLDGTSADAPASSDADAGAWAGEAHFTGANYRGKKPVFLLFINHRLVESPRLKRALEGVYGAVLPKGVAPFIYLSLDLDPRAVDVNVHPTKRAVHFLAEDAVTARTADAIAHALAGQARSRAFAYQARPVPSKDKVRVSRTDRTLDSMFPVRGAADGVQAHGADGPATAASPAPEIAKSACVLASVHALRRAVHVAQHAGLTEIVRGHVFVGVVDLRAARALVQHGTRLFLVDHAALAEELFYQLGLRQFGNFARVRLEPPPPVAHLVRLAVRAERARWRACGLALEEDEVVDRIVARLTASAPMLDEYFSLGITPEGALASVPLLLRGRAPDLAALPLLLMRLGPQVPWADEKGCFAAVLRELAYFYAAGAGVGSGSGSGSGEREERAERWRVEHVLFPALRRYLVAPKSLLERAVVQVASLPDLYRVFERC
ncbi:DNA mismatch repair protein MutL [Phellopilus nigrolimitatus]|nr:DNA mismatch repair protein MutL [Phellopilus nigrolimitatus]